ncbi:hypothetical protein Tco_1367232 [Tanacetum coccineum]
MNHGTTVLSDPVHANTYMFSRRTSANSYLQLVVNVAPIATYWSGRSWPMVNTSSASSLPHVFSGDIEPESDPLPELFFVLAFSYSLSTSFHCYDPLVSEEFDHRVDGRTYSSEASHSVPSYYDILLEDLLLPGGDMLLLKNLSSESCTF